MYKNHPDPLSFQFNTYYNSHSINNALLNAASKSFIKVLEPGTIQWLVNTPAGTLK
ncbi:hypothetical protein SAMN04487936_101528 [Halobacillus dabanensis]|uniref:Uncharacterized protein n=1 Tax=Halobacillus dabanensis TaxID=240302 RepID=A0A1I3Q2M0_HALDA|nr:hypothetical protein [Halobacillus dabanensis]SFJ28434.1 hypothetical protein SAMN04487936_101528 [Halobacillus dabanensis]